MSAVPKFLEAWDTPDTAHLPYQNAIFMHKPPIGPVHALWWPCRQIGSAPDVVLLFIPGNPGLLGFYPPFLTAIWDKSSSARLAILAHAHVGHTPGVGDKCGWDPQRYSLAVQIQNAVEALDSIKSTFSPATKIALLGHSIGSWLALQVLKVRPEAVDGLFLLFPTISQIGSTPNGRSLSWMFRPPIPRIISVISPIVRMPPALLSWFFWSWPRSQIMVLQSLLSSTPSIFAAISMGYDEMVNVRDLDSALLEKHKDRIWLYYGERDDWVGDQREAVLRAIDAHPGYAGVVYGHKDIPHAFCINHSDQLAVQCCDWLVAGGFI